MEIPFAIFDGRLNCCSFRILYARVIAHSLLLLLFFESHVLGAGANASWWVSLRIPWLLGGLLGLVSLALGDRLLIVFGI